MQRSGLIDPYVVLRFSVVVSKRILRRFATAIRSVTVIEVIRDATEERFVKDPISISNSWVQAATLLLSARVACGIHACLKSSNLLFQDNSWVLQFSLLCRRGANLTSIPDGLFASACRTLKALFTSNNRFRSKEKSSALYGHRRNRIPKQLDKSNGIHPMKPLSHLLPCKWVLDTDLSRARVAPSGACASLCRKGANTDRNFSTRSPDRKSVV